MFTEFPQFRLGSHKLPSKVEIIAIGSMWFIQSFMALTYVVVKNIQKIYEDSEQVEYFPFSYVFQGSLTGLILVSSHLILHCFASVLLVYGAAKQNKFFFIPWLVQVCISTIFNVTMLVIEWNYYDDFLLYYFITTGLQVIFTRTIIEYLALLILNEKYPDSFVVDFKSQFTSGKQEISIA